MTAEEAVAESAQGRDERTPSMPEIAVSMAGYVAQFTQHDRGGLAALRRMNPDAQGEPAFWRVMAHYDQLNRGPELELKWALILHGIALMTPTQSGETAHGRRTTDRRQWAGLCSPATVSRGAQRRPLTANSSSRLLNARGPMLRSLLVRMFRMLGAKGVTFNWREMARFILSDGYDENAAEESRRGIARWYYSAHRAAERQTSQSG